MLVELISLWQYELGCYFSRAGCTETLISVQWTCIRLSKVEDEITTVPRNVGKNHRVGQRNIPKERKPHNFEVRHPRCVSQNHKIKQQMLESQNTADYIILYIADDGNR